MTRHIVVIDSFENDDTLLRILRNNNGKVRFLVRGDDGRDVRAHRAIVYAETKTQRYIAADKWRIDDVPWTPQQLIDFMGQTNEAYRYHSPAAFALSLYKELEPDYAFMALDGFKARMSRAALYGGRCEVLQFGEFHAHQFDINSAYPWAATSMRFPNPKALDFVGKGTIQNIWNYEGVSRVCFSQYGYLPVLPTRIDGRVYYCECDAAFSNAAATETTYTHTELRYAIEQGARIESIHRQYIAPGTLKPFDRFMHHCFEQRIQTGDKIWKSIANALIGRMAVMNTPIYVYHPARSEQQLIQAGPDDIQHIGVWCVGKPIPLSANSNPLWSAMIMAKARTRLHSMTKRVQTVYMDTDCVFALHNHPGFPVADEIGLYKHIHGDYEIKGAKLYKREHENVTIIKMKGVSKAYRGLRDFERARYTSERVMLDDGVTRPYQYEGGVLQ